MSAVECEQASVDVAQSCFHRTMQKVLCVCVGHEEADKVRSALNADSARVMVANEHHGGIPDPYELGMAGYQACLALLDQAMPQVAQHISADGSCR
jgi:protein-tyrosine-phosphatase